MDKQYNTFTIDQLVEDGAFCDWVITGKNNKVWLDYIDRQSKERTQEIEKAKSLVGALSHNNESSDMDALLKNKLWKRINTTVTASEAPKAKSKIIRMMAVSSAIAASLLLFVIFNPNTDTNVEVYAESAMNVELPKNSKIKLSKNATVSYAEVGWDQERRVSLNGQAFFDVTKGKPFIVETDNGTVSVLGTSFTVLSEQDQLLVDVETGRVEVASSVKAAILQPGDRYWLNMPQDKMEEYKSGSGHDHFVFNQVKVKDILPLIKVIYNVKVNSDLVNVEAPVTSFFDSKDNLNQALENILFPLHLKFVIKGEQVVLM